MNSKVYLVFSKLDDEQPSLLKVFANPWIASAYVGNFTSQGGKWTPSTNGNYWNCGRLCVFITSSEISESFSEKEFGPQNFEIYQNDNYDSR